VQDVIFNGEGGIRTPGKFDPSTDFESAAFNHSATSPGMVLLVFNRNSLAILLVQHGTNRATIQNSQKAYNRKLFDV
jgi:hypothetical protein